VEAAVADQDSSAADAVVLARTSGLVVGLSDFAAVGE